MWSDKGCKKKATAYREFYVQSQFNDCKKTQICQFEHFSSPDILTLQSRNSLQASQQEKSTNEGEKSLSFAVTYQFSIRKSRQSSCERRGGLENEGEDNKLENKESRRKSVLDTK